MATLTEQLLELQSLDMEIGRLSRQVEELTAAIGDQMKVKAADYAIRQAETAFRAKQSDQRDREYELSQLEKRLKDHRERLYSGKGSPRDLEALRLDVEHDSQLRDQLEERALKAMEATEVARTEVERVRSAVFRVLTESSSGKEQQALERDQAQRALTDLMARREQLAESFPASVLQLYERLRQRTSDGIAVAEVAQTRCLGCRTTLPSSEIQRARRPASPVQCSACQRILHVP